MVDDARKREAIQLMQMGIVSLKNKEVSQARQCLLKACSLDPENVDALLWLTNTTTDPQERRRILMRALSLQPDHPQVRRALEKLDRELGAGSGRQPPAGAAHQPAGQESRPAAPVPPQARTEAASPVEIPPAPPGPSREEEEPGGLLTRLAAQPGHTDAAPPPAPAPQSPTDDLRAALDEEVDLEALLEANTAQPPAPPPVREVSPAPPGISLPQPTADDMAPLPPPSVEQIEIAEDLRRLERAAPAEDLGRCPRCGAVMRLNAQTRMPYCVFCGYGTTTQPDVSIPAARLWPEQPWPQAQQARHCLTCDAISLVPARLPADAPCPLCMQAIFEPSTAGLALPDIYLPFEIKEAEAAIAIEDAAGGRRRLAMTRPRAVYLPVWLFNGKGEVGFRLPRSPEGVHTETYRLLPVHGAPQIDGALLRLASHVELDRAPRYLPEAGQEMFILLPNVGLPAAVSEARGLILRDARQKTQEHPHSPGTSSLIRPRTGPLTITRSDVRDMKFQLALLPVWINDVRDGGRIRMGLANGSTGRAIVGDAPARRRR